jgi:tetratricopeptide (TPR) repeat protein
MAERKTTPKASKSNRTSATSGQRPRGVAKKVSSAAATGNAGGQFESRVQAAKLLSLALGIQASGIPQNSKIVELRFQARVHGAHTDDLLCTVEDAGGRRSRVLMQMKRGLTARKSDRAFEEAVGNAWLDYSETNFARQVDKLIIVHDQGSAHEVRGAREVCNYSRTSINAADWIQKTTEKGASNVLRRNALDSLRMAVELYKKATVTDEELWDFIRHLEFLAHDLDEEGTPEHTNYLNQIEAAVRQFGRNVDAGLVWSRLVTACTKLNAENGGVSFENLSSVIDGELVALFTAARQMLNRPLSPAGLAASLGQYNTQPSPNQAWTAPIPTFPVSSIAAQNEQLTTARSASVDKLISRQLDSIKERIKSNRYANALHELEQMGADLGPLDAHQKARWYHMRGICRWHQGDDADAANDFLKAAALCADDDKLAADKVRGLLLRDEVQSAITAGVEALERFPQSLAVWLAWANARLRNKETIELADIPKQHQAEADAVQLVAWGLHSRGRSAEARQAVLSSLRLPTANFYTRNMALGLWLEHVSLHRLNLSCLLLDAQDASALREIAAAFQPRHEKLWHFEVSTTAREAAIRLAVAHLFLGEATEALTIIDEAKARHIGDGETIKVEIEALSRLGRNQDAIERGKSSLALMSLDGLLTFAQLVSGNSDIALLEQVIERARQAFPEEQQTHDVLSAMRWDALLRSGAGHPLLAEIDGQDLLSCRSVPIITIAARALNRYRGEAVASPLVSRALALAEERSDVADRYMVATLLLSFKRYGEAAKLYESILPKGQYSDLHRDLLYCYLMTDQRSKGSALIQSFPAGWEDDNSARHLAMELGQVAGDWPFLRHLVEVQLKKEPNRALSWLFKLMVSTRLEADDAFHEELPELLGGSVRELTQLAVAELTHGEQLKGLRRLYRTRRLHLSSTESAAAHVAAHLALPEGLQPLDEAPESVKPGTSVEIKDAAGGISTITIDPAELGELPGTDEFHNVSSAAAQQILGLRLGESFVVKDGFGGGRTYTISAIKSAYRRLLELAHHSLAVSLTPSSTLRLVSLPEDAQGNTNFNALTQQLQETAERANEVLALYDANHFTLGVTARMLGRDVITLVRAWPAQKCRLYVGGGLKKERDEAAKLLEDTSRSYVVDAATLMELAQIDGLQALTRLPKVFVSSRTYDLIQAQLTLAQMDRSSGVASAEDGKLIFQEISPENRRQEVDLLSKICDVVKGHCVIVPAYGLADPPAELGHVKGVISEEEYDVLLVALEHRATVLALDNRFRAMAVYVGISALWPQIVLMHQHLHGQISLRDYAMACVNMFVRNRDFVSLRSEDLLILVQQGGFWLDFGLRQVIKHISTETTDFSSVANVILNFFKLLLFSTPCQFGAFVELVQRLLEGLLRHKHCPEDFEGRALRFLAHPKNTGSWNFNIVPFVERAIENAKAAAAREVRDEPFRAKVVFTTSPPFLLTGSFEQTDSATLESDEVSPDVSSLDAITAASKPEEKLTPEDLAHP